MRRSAKTSPAAVELVLRLRKQLDEVGWMRGADTIGWTAVGRFSS